MRTPLASHVSSVLWQLFRRRAVNTTQVQSYGMQHLSLDRSIPIASSRRNLVRLCDARAVALRCWRSRMIPAVCSRRTVFAAPRIHQDRINADVARRSWQTVSSGFFPPPLLMHFGQEQMTDGRDDPVAPKRDVVADLEVTHPGLFTIPLVPG